MKQTKKIDQLGTSIEYRVSWDFKQMLSSLEDFFRLSVNPTSN